MSNSEARKRAQEQVASPRGDEAGDVEALAALIAKAHPFWSSEVRGLHVCIAKDVLASDWLAARDAEQRRLGAEAADLPDPDIAATGDGRVIAAAINALTLTIRAAAQ